jgi:hypothetical protein
MSLRERGKDGYLSALLMRVLFVLAGKWNVYSWMIIMEDRSQRPFTEMQGTRRE